MKPIIELNNISFRYQYNKKILALDRISLSIKHGEWVAIMGRNGSGKSTLSKIINGLVLPQKGQVKVGGILLNQKNLFSIRKMIGMVFQNPNNQFVGSTVEEEVAFGLENYGFSYDTMAIRIKDSLKKVGMLNFSTKDPNKLSGGQKQCVAIAGIIALKPDIIIFDESISMLDTKEREKFISTIKKLKNENNLTIISITHDAYEASHASRIILMSEGKIVSEGTPSEIFSKESEIIQLGLDLPFPQNLKHLLSKRGFKVPEGYFTKEGLVEWIWKFVLKK